MKTIRMDQLNLRVKIVFLLFVLSNASLFSQKKYEISAGVGYPDRINLEIKYGIRTQAGISAGLWPFQESWSDNHYFGLAIGGNLYYHFPGNTLNKWYINPGFTYTHWFQKEPDANTIMLTARVGRSINFSNNTGINLDLGLTMFIYVNGVFWDFDTEFLPILPSGSISYFIKF